MGNIVEEIIEKVRPLFYQGIMWLAFTCIIGVILFISANYLGLLN
jgi:hypothetical protein